MFKKSFKTRIAFLRNNKCASDMHKKQFVCARYGNLSKISVDIFFIAFITIAFCAESFSQTGNSANSNIIDTLIQKLYSRKQFSGSILISKGEKVIYEKAFGKSDIERNIPFSISTPCYLASVSKQFTAIAILMLAQKELLTLDDHLNKYFPEFPYGDSITIRQLLNHTSGIVNYEELGIDNPNLTNQKMYESLVAHKTLQFQPGTKYDYSNSGYVLLAMIIEKVSKLSFAEFMKKNVFAPLKMNNSFVYDKSNTKQAVAKAYGKFGDESDAITNTTGDGGICSTVEDLFKWDRALYKDKLVSQPMLAQAFEPTVLVDGSKSLYGFGWMIKDDSNKTVVYHTGGSGGYRTYIERDLNNHNAIIILTNIENSPRREISQAIENILNNKSYDLPKISIATTMFNIRNVFGIDSAISFYNFNKTNNYNMYDFSEQELNLLGYKLGSINKIDEAVEIFKMNAVAYPSSSNAYESLGEAYLMKGDKNLAQHSFEESLKLDATNQDAIRMMERVK